MLFVLSRVPFLWLLCVQLTTVMVDLLAVLLQSAFAAADLCCMPSGCWPAADMPSLLVTTLKHLLFVPSAGSAAAEWYEA